MSEANGEQLVSNLSITPEPTDIHKRTQSGSDTYSNNGNLLTVPQTNYYTELNESERSPLRLSSDMSGMEITSKDPMLAEAYIERRRSSLIEFFIQAKASVFSSSINLCNANIGAGMLALPFAVYESGWLMGIILFVVFAVMSTFAFNLLMSVGVCYIYRGKISSYAIVCDDIVPKLQIFVDFFIAFGYTLTCSAYLIIIADYMPLVTKELANMDENTDSIFVTRGFWIMIFIVFLIFPTTAVKKLDHLRFSSMIALTCFIYVVIIVILYEMIPSLTIEDENMGEVHAFPQSAFAFFHAAPLYIFAYGGHPLAYILTNELGNPTLKRINILLVNAFGFVTIVYATVALFGYFTFGSSTKPNILLNYPNSDIAIIVVRIGLSIAVAFSYPVLASPWKQSMASLVFHVDKEGKDANDLVWYKYYGLVLVLIGTTIAIAMWTDDLGIVSKLQGATAGTFMQIMTPGIIYYYYDKKRDEMMIDNRMHNLKWKGAVLLIAFGAIMIPFGTTLVFLSM